MTPFFFASIDSMAENRTLEPVWAASGRRARRERAPKISHVRRPNDLAAGRRARFGPGARQPPEFAVSSVRNGRNDRWGAVRRLDSRHGRPGTDAGRAAGAADGVEARRAFVNGPYRGIEGGSRRVNGPLRGLGCWHLEAVVSTGCCGAFYSCRRPSLFRRCVTLASEWVCVRVLTRGCCGRSHGAEVNVCVPSFF